MFDYDAIVIGGGQAGLAMGYYLQRKQKTFIILDQVERVGDSWRKRYDTLSLFTPRRYNDLPGFPFPGERDLWPTKDDAADYLEAYIVGTIPFIPANHDLRAIHFRLFESKWSSDTFGLQLDRYSLEKAT